MNRSVPSCTLRGQGALRDAGPALRSRRLQGRVMRCRREPVKLAECFVFVSLRGKECYTTPTRVAQPVHVS